MPVNDRSTKKQRQKRPHRKQKRMASKKKSTPDGVSSETRKEIKRAATTIEHLIKEEMATTWSAAQYPPSEDTPNDIHPFEDHIIDGEAAQGLTQRKRLLWTAVIVMSVAIIALWAINMRSLIYDITKNDSQEGAIINIAQDDFSKILDELIETDEERRLLIDQIRSNTTPATTTTENTLILNKLIEAIRSNTSSPSSTNTSTP